MAPSFARQLAEQQAFLDRVTKIKQPCPSCGTLCDQHEAGARDKDQGRCPSCNRPLIVIVPLFAVDAPWRWQIDFERERREREALDAQG